MTESKVEEKLEQTIDIVNSYNSQLLHDIEEVKQMQKLQKMDIEMSRQEITTINEKVIVLSSKKSLTTKFKVGALICYAIIMPLLIMFLKN